jgi:hypothetical protein
MGSYSDPGNIPDNIGKLPVRTILHTSTYEITTLSKYDTRTETTSSYE